MSRVDLSTFESRYRLDTDPWRFASSPYEQGKYAATVDALEGRHYRRCFEPACSIGALTERLIQHCDRVDACDVSPSAIAEARRRMADVAGIEFVVATIPDWWPDGTFDLVVLSELGYYWDRAGWGDVVRRAVGSLEPGGDLLAVHWLGRSRDHILVGEEVHLVLAEELGPPQLEQHHPGFVVARWRP